MNYEAEDLLFRIGHAADSLTYIAYGIEKQNGDDCEEANAVHYVAHQLREDVIKLRNIRKTGN